ncbi:potassium-transporting ATPase subunit KdpA [Streptomyces tricolor]|nr:potassium-transporting ATPase subunit KdpA [Streptomyces tricolor]
MTWPAYLRAASSASSAAGVLFLYLLQRLQGVLPGSPRLPSLSPAQSFDTAVSSVTNTNWQSYPASRPWARRPDRRSGRAELRLRRGGHGGGGGPRPRLPRPLAHR